MKEEQLNALRDQISGLIEKTRDPATKLTSDDIRIAVRLLPVVADHVLKDVIPEPEPAPKCPAGFQRSVER
jgi:hypothetical protein